jgi:hypothetical protein
MGIKIAGGEKLLNRIAKKFEGRLMRTLPNFLVEGNIKFQKKKKIGPA